MISNRAPVRSGVAIADLLYVLDPAEVLRDRSYIVARNCDIWVVYFSLERMKRIFAYMRGLFEDPIFVRACMFFWGLPLLVLGCVVVLLWRPVEGWEWFGFSCLLLVGVLGGYLMGVAVFGAPSRLDRASNYLSDGDIVGIVFAIVVLLVALPTTALIRAWSAKSSRSSG